MKISIITVCKNAETDIESTIISVLSQTYKNIEYIIIDGDSNDKTYTIIKKYKKIDRILIKNDTGIYQAMNRGIKLATGDVTMFLNAGDVYFDKSVIQTIANCFINNAIDLLYGNLIIIDEVKKIKKTLTYGKINKLFFHHNSLPHPSTAYKSYLFKKFGAFNESFKIVGDYEWYLRMITNKNIKLYYMNYPVAIFKFGGISTHKKYIHLHKQERKQVLDKYFTKHELLFYNIFLSPIIKVKTHLSFLLDK